MAIGILAFAVRLLSTLHSGGLTAILGYDEGVYFGASTSWVSGLMPYRDFVLVHPPASVVLLSPFALLGQVTSEPTGWAVARLFVMVLGAVNAMLLYAIGRRVNRVAGVVAGGLYAVWGPAVHVERTTMLEAFILLGIVVALWALLDAHVPPVRLVIAGVALGIGSSTKLWGLIPLAVILGWLLLSRAWRSAAIVGAVAAGVFTAIVLPFLLVAPERMYDLVILAQLGRGKGGTHEHDRLAQMFGLNLASFVRDYGTALAVGLGALAVVIVAMGIAWARVPRARLWVVMLLVQLAVLIAVPVYFEGYSSFIGPALVLVCGTATGVIWSAVAGRSPARVGIARGLLVVGVLLIASLSASRAVRDPVDLKPHLHAITAATKDARCVGSDTAGLLLAADVLGRNIKRGCPTVVDFDGTVYSFDDGSNPQHLSSIDRRLHSVAYQRFMRDYFAANDVLLMHRGTADGLDQQARAMLRSRSRLYHQHGLRILGPSPT